MAKFRSASRRISTTGSGWRHSQNAAAIRATSAIEKNKTMKPLSNQSSVCPRSRTTSRHAKPAATRTIPSPSIRSLPLRQDQRHNPDRNVDKEDPPPTPVVCDPPAERRADHGGSHDGHAVESAGRFCGGNVSTRMACSTGARPPPPTPCKTRKKMSKPSEGASPHSRELNVKRTTHSM